MTVACILFIWQEPVEKPWRGLAESLGSTRMLYYPRSARTSATSLPISCCESPISKDLCVGCIRDISNWEVPSRSMAVPRVKCEVAEVPLAWKRFSKWYFLLKTPPREWSDLIFLGFPMPISMSSIRILAAQSAR